MSVCHLRSRKPLSLLASGFMDAGDGTTDKHRNLGPCEPTAPPTAGGHAARYFVLQAVAGDACLVGIKVVNDPLMTTRLLKCPQRPFLPLQEKQLILYLI